MSKEQCLFRKRLTHSSYLITNYEHSNFSVSPCNFEDGTSKNLIPIPSIAKTPSHQSRRLIIGASVGAASSVLLTVVILTLVFWRKHRLNQRAMASDTSSVTSMSLEKPRIMTVCSVREIDQNSLCGAVRELPDNGTAELQDETSPSGSGNLMPEMSSSVPIVHELRTQYSSRINSMLRTHSANKGSIIRSTEISRKSWTSLEPSDGTPCVETLISATGTNRETPEDSRPSIARRNPLSMRSKPLDLSSQNLTTRLAALKNQLPTPLNLDRSLPPTPISESPQVSPISDMLRKSHSLRRNRRILKSVPSAITGAPTTPNLPSSKFSIAFAERGCHPSLCFRKGIEITIPPGHSDTDISDVSAVSSEEQIPNTTWL